MEKRCKIKKGMKKVKSLGAFILVVLMSMCNVECSHEGSNLLCDRISDIKFRGDSMPSQALLALDSLREDVLTSGSMRAERLFELTEIRLKDKADWRFENNDTIIMLCRYFAKHGTPNEQMEAQFYLGRVNREMKNYPLASEGFLHAIRIGESGAAVDLQILQRAYSQQSHLYTELLNRKGAVEMARKGMNLAIQTETLNPIYIMDAGTAELHAGDTASAMALYTDAVEMIRKEKSGARYPAVMSELLMRFSEAGMKDEADYCIGVLNELPERRRPHNYLYGLASYSERFLSADSAAQVHHRMYETASNWTDRLHAAWALMWYYRWKGDYKTAFEYATALNTSRDSVMREREMELTAIASGEQLYRHSQEAEQKAHERSAHSRQLMLYAIITALVVILCISQIYSLRLKKTKKRLLQKERLIQEECIAKQRVEGKLKELDRDGELKQARLNALDERLNKQDEMLLERMLKLAEQERALEEMTRELEETKKEMQRQSRVLKEKEELLTEQRQKIQRMHRENIHIRSTFDNNMIIEKVMNMAASNENDKLENTEWLEFCLAVEEMYPDGRALERMKTKREAETFRRTYALWRIGLPNAAICRLTGQNRQTISRWVTEIEEAAHGESIEKSI